MKLLLIGMLFLAGCAHQGTPEHRPIYNCDKGRVWLCVTDSSETGCRCMTRAEAEWRLGMNSGR